MRRFGEAFDAIGKTPGGDVDGKVLFDAEERSESSSEVGGGRSKWREDLPKRLLLATLDDDSTVVYYIVHDGIVKPRQN